MVGVGNVAKPEKKSLAKAPERDMRILNVCETAKGGIATYLNLLWKTRGDRQTLKFIVQDTHRTELGADMSVETFAIGRRRALNPFRLALRARKVARTFKPHIVIFHSTFSLPAMALLRVLRIKAKLVYCAHGWAANRYEVFTLKHKIAQLVEGYLAGFSDVVVNISRHDLAYAKRAGYRGNHVVIENAVEDIAEGIGPKTRNKQADIEDQLIRLLFVGRFDRQKGLDVLLEAFSNASKKRSDLVLSVIGDAVLGDSPHAANSQGKITFHGWVDQGEIAAHYGAADILVVPSRWEGFGLIVAEAMRAGTPVLVSDRGNLPDIVQEGQTGYVAPLSVGAFTQALLDLDKETIGNMRPLCRKLYQNRFHQDRFAREIYAMCDGLLK